MQQKPIRCCRHLSERLALRNIAPELPRQVIRRAEQLFTDVATGYRIAISTLPYRGREHLMMVAFEDTDEEVVAITIHPLSQTDVDAKLRSGRWVC
jgi:hypothetical protein